MSIQIRPEQSQDIAAIELITVAAFRNAAHASHTEQFIVRALRSSGQLSVSLVAVEHGNVIGHVALSPIAISSGVPNWYGLGPISVSPTHQGQGVGSRLITQALARIRTLDASGCVVLGDPDYYAKFGFKPVRSLVLLGALPQYFQALSFAGPVPSGTVSYHEAFAARG